MKIIIIFFTLTHFISFGIAQNFQKIVETEPSTQNYFGSSGDIHGEYAVVTSIHGSNPNSWTGGLANIYKISKEGKWELTRTMYPEVSSSQDRFGQDACAIWDKQVIIGDWMNVNQECGAAHIFKFEGDTTWRQTAMLKPIDYNNVESFGKAVDIFKTTTVVGAGGAVYIFTKTDDGTWKQTQKLKTPTDAEGFGNNVVIDGDFIVVSAEWEDIAGKKNMGAVYVYKKQTNESWSLLEKITLQSDKTQEEVEFGNSIAINNNRILIGAANENMGEVRGAGAAYLYRLSDNKFLFEQKLYASNFGHNKYRFGEKVAITDDFIVIAEAQDQNHKGSVYVFEKKEGTYIEVDRIISPIRSYYGNDFGQSGLAIDGNRLYVGAPGDGYCEEELSKCGSAYFYNLGKSKPKLKAKPFIPAGNTTAIMDKKMEEFNADSIVFDPINHDDLYNLRSKETQLWGLYQSGKELIPMEYEHINFSGWNHPFTFVKKKGKWGVFLGSFNDGKLSVQCRYDELKIYEHQEYLFVAGKRNGKWRWVNWATSEELHETKEYHQELIIYNNWNPGNYSHFDLKNRVRPTKK